MSPRWVSLKLCAEAELRRDRNARANNAGMRRRNEGIGKSLCGGFPGILLKAGSWNTGRVTDRVS